MNTTSLAERIRIESQILGFVREALLVAMHAPIDPDSAEQWCERSRFLTESFRRHVERLFRIKWEVDDRPLVLEAERPAVVDDLADIEAQQRQLLAELNLLTGEAHDLSPDNPSNLHAFRQRMIGFMERFDDLSTLESKIWMDTFQIDIGGEG